MRCVQWMLVCGCVLAAHPVHAQLVISDDALQAGLGQAPDSTSVVVSDTQPDRRQERRHVAPYVVLFAGQAFDTATTIVGLRGGYAVTDLNPLFGHSVGKVLLSKAGVSAGMWLLMRTLHKQDRHEDADMVGYAIGTLGGTLGALNWLVMSEGYR